jgi:outer membrane protein TolC
MATPLPLGGGERQLNQLIGRDLRAPFDVVNLPETLVEQVSRNLAQARALDARPDVRQARVKLQQAEIARQMAKTDYLPDAQLTVSLAIWCGAPSMFIVLASTACI